MLHENTSLSESPELVLVGGAVAVLLLAYLDAAIARHDARAARRELEHMRAQRDVQLANAMRAGESKARGERCQGCSTRITARPRSA